MHFLVSCIAYRVSQHTLILRIDNIAHMFGFLGMQKLLVFAIV